MALARSSVPSTTTWAERPVYVVRLGRDLPALAERYELERVPSVPGPGDLYRVVGPGGPAQRDDGPPA